MFEMRTRAWCCFPSPGAGSACSSSGLSTLFSPSHACSGSGEPFQCPRQTDRAVGELLWFLGLVSSFRSKPGLLFVGATRWQQRIAAPGSLQEGSTWQHPLLPNPRYSLAALSFPAWVTPSASRSPLCRSVKWCSKAVTQYCSLGFKAWHLSLAKEKGAAGWGSRGGGGWWLDLYPGTLRFPAAWPRSSLVQFLLSTVGTIIASEAQRG